MASFAFVLLSVLSQVPQPQLVEPGPKVTLRSELGEISSEAGVARAEGGVVLESGGLVLRADVLEYLIAERLAEAEGNLLFIDGTLVILAESAQVDLANNTLAADNATLFQKTGIAQARLRELTDAKAARTAGKNELVVTAARIERPAPRHFQVDRLRFSSCDCPERPPDWSISASHADILLGERAILNWPVFYAWKIPVFALPAIYFPLSSRRTGLLFPRGGYSTKSGFFLDQPLFITLGRSYDLTLTAGYRFGVDPELPKPDHPPGFEGPAASAELRYTPVQGTSGRLLVGAIYDRTEDPTTPPVEPRARGWRGQVTWRHASEYHDWFFLRGDADLVSDKYFSSDGTTGIVGIQSYLRSQAHADVHAAGSVTSLATTWYQDLANEFSLRDGRTVVDFQRPVWLSFSLPSTTVAGPLRGAFDLTGSWVKPIALLPPADLPGSANPQWKTSLMRVDVRPKLSVPVVLGDFLRAEAYAQARGDVSAFRAGDRSPQWRGGTLVGAFLGTELSRRYGDLRHTIEPSLEARWFSRPFGDLLPPSEPGLIAPRDEFDTFFLTSPIERQARGALGQGIATIRTRLGGKNGEIGRLELGQGLDLRTGELADTFGSLSAIRLSRNGWSRCPRAPGSTPPMCRWAAPMTCSSRALAATRPAPVSTCCSALP